jgi:hypothetical protein
MDWEMSWLRRRAAGLAVLLGVAPAGADPPAWSWQVGLGSTLFSRSPDNGFQLARAQGLAGAVDRRFSDLHLFFQGELNGWRDRRDDGSIDLTLALNLGVGLGLDHAGGHLRSTVVGGTSLLLLPDDVDSAPSAGLFVDLRPVAFLWPVGSSLDVGLVPLSLVVALPVLTGIPLVSLQYRTTVFLEAGF